MEVANIGGSWLWGNPTLMTSADGGYTYTFGTDGNGYATFLLAGHVYPSLSAIPDYPWTPGRDYVDEGTQIRSTNNTVFPLAPYFQGITSPTPMASGVNPVIYPEQSRILIVLKAVWNFAEAGKRDLELAARSAARYTMEWNKHSLLIRKHLRGRGRLGGLTSYMGLAVQGSNGLGW